MESGILSNFSPPIHLSPANSVEGISKKGLQRYTDCGKIQGVNSKTGRTNDRFHPQTP
jgi:predicted site-specific integrase-resolvase